MFIMSRQDTDKTHNDLSKFKVIPRGQRSNFLCLGHNFTNYCCILMTLGKKSLACRHFTDYTHDSISKVKVTLRG